jgi:hypothetical protein
MDRRAFVVFLIVSLLILGVLNFNAQATSEFKEIERLTEMERAKPEEKIVRPQVEYSAGGYRNPFKKLIEKADIKSEVNQAAQKPKQEEMPPPPQFTVQGIVWGGDFPQAIIDNKVVKAGDSIEGYVIKDISKEGVTLLFKGFEYKLSSPATGGKI